MFISESDGTFWLHNLRNRAFLVPWQSRTWRLWAGEQKVNSSWRMESGKLLQSERFVRKLWEDKKHSVDLNLIWFEHKDHFSISFRPHEAEVFKTRGNVTIYYLHRRKCYFKKRRKIIFFHLFCFFFLNDKNDSDKIKSPVFMYE